MKDRKKNSKKEKKESLKDGKTEIQKDRDKDLQMIDSLIKLTFFVPPPPKYQSFF